MTSEIELSAGHDVLTIKMNRPLKKNALTADMYNSMAEGLRKAAQSDDIRCTLILGSPGAFCAGNDIGDFIQAANAGPEGMQPVFDFLEEIIMAKKPVVAGVDGLAIGVGTTMLMHCDYVLASETSTFKTPFTDLGLVPEAGSSLIGPAIMGYHRAFAMLAMGETFDAEQARAAGIVNRITRPENLARRAHEAAEKIASKPPEALRLSRELIRGDRSDIVKRMLEEAVLFKERLASEEAKAAFMAFMSKGKV